MILFSYAEAYRKAVIDVGLCDVVATLHVQFERIMYEMKLECGRLLPAPVEVISEKS